MLYGLRDACLPYHTNRNEAQKIRPLLVGRISVCQGATGSCPQGTLPSA